MTDTTPDPTGSDPDGVPAPSPQEILTSALEVLPHTMEALTERIREAVGEASVCWDGGRSGVFDSDRALGVSERLLLDVVEMTALGRPSLGCATTAELLDELKARIDVCGPGLGYRPVGP